MPIGFLTSAPFLETLLTTATTTAAGYGVASALAPKTPKINVPPPPGAAMIDPAGQAAAANQRARAAAAGGIQSTITGAGSGNNTGPTGGGKTLLGS